MVSFSSGLYHVRKKPNLARVHFSAEAFPQLDAWITYDKQYAAMEHVQGINLKTEFGISASQLQTSPYIFDGPTQRQFSFILLWPHALGMLHVPIVHHLWLSGTPAPTYIIPFQKNVCCIIQGSTMETQSLNYLLFNIWQQWSVYWMSCLRDCVFVIYLTKWMVLKV